ncbi:unnamed protein product [Protopolystoma xenopodis]|uniref:Uncharacterized protein n=1 Tax=Protopolystoma xenopodis TaxID=117903 RepID=A0A448X6N1_9PLAT|nr:unnamed protein product [Protopolystoma xenopodis]
MVAGALRRDVLEGELEYEGMQRLHYSRQMPVVFSGRIPGTKLRSGMGLVQNPEVANYRASHVSLRANIIHHYFPAS